MKKPSEQELRDAVERAKASLAIEGQQLDTRLEELILLRLRGQGEISEADFDKWILEIAENV